MSTVGIVATIIFFLVAAALLIFGVIAAAGKLPGNAIVGLRVAEVRSSKKIWDAAHRVAGMMCLLGGLSSLFAGFLATVVSGWLWLLPIILFIVSLVVVGAGANMGARTAAIMYANEQQSTGEAAAEAPVPAADLDALRTAAEHSDTERG